MDKSSWFIKFCANGLVIGLILGLLAWGASVQYQLGQNSKIESSLNRLETNLNEKIDTQFDELKTLITSFKEDVKIDLKEINASIKEINNKLDQANFGQIKTDLQNQDQKIKDCSQFDSFLYNQVNLLRSEHSLKPAEIPSGG